MRIRLSRREGHHEPASEQDVGSSCCTGCSLGGHDDKVGAENQPSAETPGSANPMTIKTKLLAIAIVPIAVFLVTGVTLLTLHRDTNRAHTREDLNDEIAHMTSDLIILTYEYGLTRGDRPRLQWTNQYQAAEAHLEDMPAHFEKPVEKSHLREMARCYKNAGTLFEALCEFDRKALSAEPSPRARELRNNMINRLILELQTVTPAVDLLQRLTHEDQARYLHSESRLILAFMLFLVALVTPLSYFIIKGISRSLAALQQGIKTVASGDLVHRIRLNTGDELGALARGFDEMTGQLNSITVSRDKLVQEIDERTKAEVRLAHQAALNAGMVELSGQVLMAESIEEVSITTLREAQKSTGSRFGFVGHIDRATGFLVCPTMTHDIWDQCGVAGKSIVFEKHGGLFGWVLLHKKPLMTNDPDHDERAMGVPHGHLPIRRFVSVPAMHGDVLIGQIALANAERDYTGEDLAVLERLALIYALGIRRKQAEEDLRALNEKLESLVDDRTADLEKTGRDLRDNQMALMNIVDDLNQKTADLEKANAKLSELDRLKSMFIASMSHELRTPLNSIIGFSSILQNAWVGPVTQEQEENLAIILRSGKHLLSLINDVIDVSKVEAGIFESRAEDFDLHAVVSEAVSSLEKEAADKGLAVQVDAVHQNMHTDRRRLLQCLLNLLSNAIKFTESGELRVQARLLAGGNFTELSVTDTGIGIVDEDMPKLFQPFVRLESPLKLKAPGTGLGLYLSRKLATEVLKGDILYLKGPAQGSTFTIRIPVRV